MKSLAIDNVTPENQNMERSAMYREMVSRQHEAST